MPAIESASAMAPKSSAQDKPTNDKATFTTYAPLFIALITASVFLFGYIYEGYKQRSFEIFRTQQEIYTALIQNFMKQERIIADMSAKPDPRDRSTPGQAHPELEKLWAEERGLLARLSVYGSDECIKAYLKHRKDSNSRELIFALRQNLFPSTQISESDINGLVSN
jgi:hypothetical protein